MPKPGQIPLPFPDRSLSFAEMTITDANRAAIAAVRRLERWPYHVFCLVGPGRSGLSTLALAWAHDCQWQVFSAQDLDQIDASLIEDMASGNIAIDRADLVEAQGKLLHLVSSAERLASRVLMTASRSPAHWLMTSRDLASRLRSAPIAELGPPDEPLMRARLRRAFARQFLQLPQALEDYLVVRLGLRFSEIEDTVSLLSGAAVGRAVTVPLAREVLSDNTAEDDGGEEGT